MASSDLYEYHERQQYPSHKKAIAGLLIVFGGFIGFGVYALYNLWEMYSTDIMSAITGLGLPTILTDNLWLIGVAVGGLVLLSIIMAVLASTAARRLGGTLIYIGAGVMLILTWIIPIFVLIMGAPIGTVWPVMIPGLFTLLITVLLFTVFKDRVRRAGEIIKLTGQVTLDEKGTFVPPLLT
ncbi:hypothetical protein EU545_05570, partial [Candidatus Thorarchaeota archaeon]